MDRHIASALANPPRFSPAARWIIAIVGLLGGNFAAMFVLIAHANYGSSQVVPSYHDHARRYESAVEQAARNRALGWSFDVAIVDNTVTVTADNDTGTPLIGAHIAVAATYRSGGEPLAAVLVEAIPGTYTGSLAGIGRVDPTAPPGATGLCDLSITIERDGKRLVRELAVLAQ